MANRRFEMYEVRQIIARMRLGVPTAVPRAQRIGRRKVAQIRRLAGQHGWLDPAGALPDDAQLAAVFKVTHWGADEVKGVLGAA